MSNSGNKRENKEAKQLLKAKFTAMWKQPKLLYEYCIRNGMRVPARKSRICTTQYLTEVTKKQCFCFPHKDIKMPHKVLRPPPLRILVLMLVEALTIAVRENFAPPELNTSIERLAVHISNRDPDAAFCLEYLGTLHIMGVE